MVSRSAAITSAEVAYSVPEVVLLASVHSVCTWSHAARMWCLCHRRQNTGERTEAEIGTPMSTSRPVALGQVDALLHAVGADVTTTLSRVVGSRLRVRRKPDLGVRAGFQVVGVQTEGHDVARR